MGYVSTPLRIQSAFEKAWIRFLDNEPGVGLRHRVEPQSRARTHN